jgi:hypothetical protein
MYEILTMQRDGGGYSFLARICDAGNPPKAGAIAGGAAGGGHNPVGEERRVNVDAQDGLIDQLEGALAGKDLSKRAEVLRRVTDLFMAGSGRFSDEQIELFATVDNRGAQFSPSGMSTLVKRAQDNGDLALRVWSRPDIARQDLARLFAQASEMVRGKLEAANPQQAELIRAAVADASEEIQAAARAESSEHAQALAHMRALHSLGQLDEPRLLGFVREGHFDRTVVALSLMCNVPVGLIERALVQSEQEQLLVLAKAIELSWETAKALLTLQAGRGGLAK